MRKCLKSRKHTFKNLHNLVQSLTDKPINDKLLVFSDKIVFVWISSQKPRVCQKARGEPLGRLMPDPRDWQCVQMPRSCPGGGGGGGGWTQLELTDALKRNTTATTPKKQLGGGRAIQILLIFRTFKRDKISD